MIRNNIRNTLLNRLFLHPRPRQRNEYLSSTKYLYPNPKDFILFLTTEDNQDLVKYAKTIIYRLLFHHRCPPPSHLLINLLDSQQTDVEVIKNGDYVPRDHFVHLVHLYLLGIYIFTYHNTIHSKCISKLIRLKRRFQNGPLLMQDNCYHIFSIVWSYFVLYHDLGYPLERILPKNRKEVIDEENDVKKYHDNIKPFTKIIKDIHKDLSFKALARLIACQSLLEDEHPMTLQEALFDHFSDSIISSINSGEMLVPSQTTSHEEVLDEETALSTINHWASAVSLPQITGENDLKLLRSLLPDLKIGTYLEDTYTGQVLLLIFGPFGNHECHQLIPSTRLPQALRKEKCNWIKNGLLTGKVPSHRYCWRYFAKEPASKLNQLLSNLFLGIEEDFKAVSNHIVNYKEFNDIKTIGTDSSSELAFIAYHELIKIREYTRDDDDSKSSFEVQREKYEDISYNIEKVTMKLPELLSKSIEKVLNQEKENPAFRNFIQSLLISKSETEAANELISKANSRDFVEKLNPVLTKEIKDGVLNPILRKYSTKVATNHLRDKIKGCIDSKRKPGFDPFASVDIKTEFSLNDIIRYPMELCSEMDRSLNKYKLNSFKSVIEKYLPSWVEAKTEIPNSSFIDHGFASSIIALTTSHEYRAIIQSFEDVDVNSSILNIALGIATEDEKIWLGIEQKMLVGIIAKSILIHNIFPSDVRCQDRQVDPNKYYRTQLSSQPFTYLAVLADGLQKWDRKHLMNQAKSNLSDYIPGNKYNIEIINDLICVSVCEDELDMSGQQKSLRDSLNDYLTNANSLIKLELSEKANMHL